MPTNKDMYSGSINQCYWAGATGPTQCETCTEQGTETTTSPILAYLGPFDIWLWEMWIPPVLHPCQPKSTASTQLLAPHRSAQLTPHSPPCTKSNIIFPALRGRKLFPARGTPWEVWQDNILLGAPPQLLKMVPDLLLNPLPEFLPLSLPAWEIPS